MLVVALYLAAVVAANLIVTAFGPGVSVLTAFGLIGLNISSRDWLHEAWSGKGLRWKMGLLIAAGGALSWLLNANAARIAIASSAAFAVSESADALIYHLLRKRGATWRGTVNGSNLVSAALDSVLFPMLAFGAFLPVIVLGQFAAKVLGGAMWGEVLAMRKIRVSGTTAALLLLSVVPLKAQSLSVGVGEFRTEHHRADVIEAVVLVPVGPVVPNLIASWEFGEGWQPVLIPQIGKDVFVRFPIILGVDVGASAGPWDDYRHWEPGVSGRFIGFIHGPLKLITIASWQPWNDWARGVVVKLDYTLLSAR